MKLGYQRVDDGPRGLSRVLLSFQRRSAHAAANYDYEYPVTFNDGKSASNINESDRYVEVHHQDW